MGRQDIRRPQRELDEYSPLDHYIIQLLTSHLAAELPHHWLPKLKQEIPLQAFGTCSEVAHAVTFLIENQYANNCVLNLDGGLSAV